MAEIKYNNLYNELTPMERRFYDQVFSQQYKPNQENLMLSSQPAYNEMKAVYEAQQDVPKKSLLDSLNLFSSASAAEKPTVPNLSLGYSMPTFDLGTGITNTTAATPFKIGIQDILSQYNVPGLRSQNLQDDLAQQIVEENRQKVASDFVNVPQDYYQSIPGGITQTTPMQNLGIDTSYGVASEEDVEQVDSLTGEKKFNVLDLLSNFIPGKGIGSFLAGMLPQDSPEVRQVKNFYAKNFGVNKAGSVASGIMQGYNPVSGGFLNMITGGKYGEPMQVGLARAMQKRIESILGRKLPQTNASKKKVEELRNLQLREIRDRVAGGESLSSIGKSTFSGKGMAFEKKSGGSSGKKGTSSERNYGGR